MLQPRIHSLSAGCIDALNSPDCPESQWWTLAKYDPIGAIQSPLFGLMTLAEPETWLLLEQNTADSWLLSQCKAASDARYLEYCDLLVQEAIALFREQHPTAKVSNGRFQRIGEIFHDYATEVTDAHQALVTAQSLSRLMPAGRFPGVWTDLCRMLRNPRLVLDRFSFLVRIHMITLELLRHRCLPHADQDGHVVLWRRWLSFRGITPGQPLTSAE